MIRRIVLSSDQLEELKKYGLGSLPLESCALLAGTVNQESVNVRKIIFVKNADKSPTNFTVDPDELFQAYRQAESRGLDIVGIFHSHPAPARPSATDIKYMEINPVPWLILSTTDNEFKVFLHDGSVRELELLVN
jgi:proteasome lid subunit RPN8/RPN11